jgi:hypothetical protein
MNTLSHTWKNLFLSFAVISTLLSFTSFNTPTVIAQTIPLQTAGSVTPAPGSGCGDPSVCWYFLFDPSNIDSIQINAGDTFNLYIYPAIIDTAGIADITNSSSTTFAFDTNNVASFNLVTQQGGTWDASTGTWSYTGLAENTNTPFNVPLDQAPTFVPTQNIWLQFEITALADFDTNEVLFFQSIDSVTTVDFGGGPGGIFDFPENDVILDIFLIDLDGNGMSDPDQNPTPDPTPDPDPTPIPNDPVMTITLPEPTETQSTTPRGGLIRTGGSDY